MTYTYEPEKIFDGGINQMRFELGDIAVNGLAEQTCVMCDEEYQGVLQQSKGNFRMAKILALRAIVSRLSFEVDIKVHDLSMNLPKRRQYFQELLNKLEQSVQFPVTSGGNSTQKEAYFYLGMQENENAK